MKVSGAEEAGFTGGDGNFGGVGYEIIAGYKQFFTPEFGLRYYANFAGANTSATIEGTDETAKLNVMNYGVNVDALYNFINDDSLSFGAFLGLGLGMNSWSGDTVKNIKNDLSSIGKVKTSGFDLALNLGVRTEIAKHHGIEVAARVPFLATTLIDKDGIKGTLQQTYNVGARYIFSF
ncbi:MAG: outer membrane protein [Helicobacter sp.]|nr:outer membrane protein [Helicobacter sp.]